jgi:ribulose-phosphate 3-epimerase
VNVSDQIFISASLLGANPLRLGEAIEQAKLAGASAIHIDMMDGHFVSKIAQGTEVVAAVRSETDLLVDVHLQVARPELVRRRPGTSLAWRIRFERSNDL